jgi:hypothetical protein
MKPYAEIKTVTKSLVDTLLAMNTNNRIIKHRVVERYKRDIASGNWALTNQGIGISADGVLIDGQHRLLAISQSGYPPIQILVVYGLSMDSQKHVDQQAKRSARDLLMFAFNARVSRSAPAIGNCILKFELITTGYSPTISELMECIDNYMDEIQALSAIPKNANFFAAPFMASFTVAAKQHGIHRIADFMRSVEEGELLTKNMPAFHLRNLIVTQKKSSGGSSVQKERMMKCNKAIAAYLEGKEMGVLRA